MLNRTQFEAELVSRKIFYFACPELNTDIPHYFILVTSQPEHIIVLSCCTSQFETVRKLIEVRKLPYETLVYIKSSEPDNPFTKDTYINCNEYFPFTIDEFYDMYTDEEITIIGDLPEVYFEQIILGFKNSPLIEEELKTYLPII